MIAFCDRSAGCSHARLPPHVNCSAQAIRKPSKITCLIHPAAPGHLARAIGQKLPIRSPYDRRRNKPVLMASCGLRLKRRPTIPLLLQTSRIASPALYKLRWPARFFAGACAFAAHPGVHRRFR